MRITPRWGTRYPELRGDGADVPRWLEFMALDLDSHAKVDQGTREQRLLQAPLRGFFWTETDTGLFWIGLGSVWYSINNFVADGAPWQATLRSLGTGSQQAAAGDDVRFSDERTPINNSVTATKVHTSLKPSSGAGASVEALRRLGSTAAEAVAGNDSRVPTQSENDALVGLGLRSPTGANPFVTWNDPVQDVAPLYQAGVETYGTAELTIHNTNGIQIVGGPIWVPVLYSSPASNVLTRFGGMPLGTSGSNGFRTMLSNNTASSFPRVDQIVAVAPATRDGDWTTAVATGTPTSGATLSNLSGSGRHGSVGNGAIVLYYALVPARWNGTDYSVILGNTLDARTFARETLWTPMIHRYGRIAGGLSAGFYSLGADTDSVVLRGNSTSARNVFMPGIGIPERSGWQLQYRIQALISAPSTVGHTGNSSRIRFGQISGLSTAEAYTSADTNFRDSSLIPSINPGFYVAVASAFWNADTPASYPAVLEFMLNGANNVSTVLLINAQVVYRYV